MGVLLLHQEVATKAKPQLRLINEVQNNWVTAKDLEAQL